jgi:hypothetical protein
MTLVNVWPAPVELDVLSVDDDDIDYSKMIAIVSTMGD